MAKTMRPITAASMAPKELTEKQKIETIQRHLRESRKTNTQVHTRTVMQDGKPVTQFYTLEEVTPMRVVKETIYGVEKHTPFYPNEQNTDKIAYVQSEQTGLTISFDSGNILNKNERVTTEPVRVEYETDYYRFPDTMSKFGQFLKEHYTRGRRGYY